MPDKQAQRSLFIFHILQQTSRVTCSQPPNVLVLIRVSRCVCVCVRAPMFVHALREGVYVSLIKKIQFHSRSQRCGCRPLAIDYS